MARTKYNRYSSQIREEIVRTKNPKRFPKLNIPRSTAHYWIKESQSVDSGQKRIKEVPDLQEHVRLFLKMLLRALSDEPDISVYSSKEKQAILRELSYNRKLWSGFLTRSLRAKLEIRLKLCEASPDGVCIKRYPGRLSKTEVAAMRNYIESKLYAHLSIASLIWLGRRNGDVICNGKTWRKYIKRLGWNRPPKPLKVKHRKVGLRASRPHQYWHVDASTIDLVDGSRNFLQVVIDNYSRYVIAWHLTDRISAEFTVNLVAKAKEVLKDMHLDENPCCLLSDAGPENDNLLLGAEVKKSPIIFHRIAKREIWASNAMAESFFKALKSQYLCYQKIRHADDLENQIHSYIELHNNEIPYEHLGGHTPREKIENSQVNFPKKKDMTKLLSSQTEVCRLCKLAKNPSSK